MESGEVDDEAVSESTASQESDNVRSATSSMSKTLLLSLSDRRGTRYGSFGMCNVCYGSNEHLTVLQLLIKRASFPIASSTATEAGLTASSTREKCTEGDDERDWRKVSKHS